MAVGDGRVVSAQGLLAEFTQAGLLEAPDVHTALLIGRSYGETHQNVVLGIALTMRALRAGSVCLPIDQVRSLAQFFIREDDVQAGVTPELDKLPWPDPQVWLAELEDSPLVGDTDAAPNSVPVRLVDGELYLERYWQDQESIVKVLAARSQTMPTVDHDRLEASLARLFHDDPREADQRRAVQTAVMAHTTVIAGGPGTGKTTTIAKVVAAVCDQWTGPGQPRIALAAPTGKAAARLTESLADSGALIVSTATENASPLGEPLTTTATDEAKQGTLSGGSASNTPPGISHQNTPPGENLGEGEALNLIDGGVLQLPPAVTLHRLLGARPDQPVRYGPHQTLPCDLVVVDEMSMVSLSLMARLLEALAPTSRLVMVGDPGQLTPVDAGAVLADITAADVPGPDGHSAVVELRHGFRFDSDIATLAEAIRSGDAGRTLEVIRTSPAVEYIDADPAMVSMDSAPSVRDELVHQATEIHQAAARGDAASAMSALESHRLLCAHRTGPYGVTRWSPMAERLQRDDASRAQEWFIGRPLLASTNISSLGISNGDTGVVIATDQGPRAAMSNGMLYPPFVLEGVDTMYAMTVHKSQGSQFDRLTLVLPSPESPLLTRELLYTAVTRAKHAVRIIGRPEAIIQAVQTPARRASGLTRRLTTPGS